MLPPSKALALAGIASIGERGDGSIESTLGDDAQASAPREVWRGRDREKRRGREARRGRKNCARSLSLSVSAARDAGEAAPASPPPQPRRDRHGVARRADHDGRASRSPRPFSSLFGSGFGGPRRSCLFKSLNVARAAEESVLQAYLASLCVGSRKQVLWRKRMLGALVFVRVGRASDRSRHRPPTTTATDPPC